MEIERKYEVLLLPDHLEQYKVKKIEQGYLCHNPTVRIRKSNEAYILTYKSRKGLKDCDSSEAIVHNEVELPLTEEAYNTLKSKTEGNMVYKSRYLIPISDELTAELDVFHGILEGLIIVEVEFPDLTSASRFIPPAWFGKELSKDKRYSNYHLSKLNSLDDLAKES